MEAADEFVQQSWAKAVLAWPYPENEQLFFMTGTIICMILGYWVPNIILYTVWKLDLFASYKVNPSDKNPPPELVKETVVKNFTSLCTVLPLAAYFGFYHTCAGSVFTEPPPLTTFAWQFIVFFVLNDAWFYWGHRLAHDDSGEGGGMGSPSFYQLVHKKHHKYTWTIGWAAVYATELEDILINFPSTFLPPLLVSFYCPVHAAVWFAYLLVRMEETVEGHSGYRMPLSPWHLLRSNDFHAFHHRFYNKGNFGIFRWWDYCMGTDKAYRHMRVKEDKGWWD
eukprot:TRINITY_DN7847_c0_g1_i1.p2 TRINITY_DN7847_c0_g1~~TRINITY_DN7847_c0_g1_i1.p2  ORF type:complete len:311 (+),score=103.52 TRINITY_DN7847_c0_g1_i1:91-933(+)